MVRIVEYLRKMFAPQDGAQNTQTVSTTVSSTVTSTRTTSPEARDVIQRRLADQRRALGIADAHVDAQRAARR